MMRAWRSWRGKGRGRVTTLTSGQNWHNVPSLAAHPGMIGVPPNLVILIRAPRTMRGSSHCY